MVVIDNAKDPTEIAFPPGFNAAEAFIDRHAERARRAAILWPGGSVSYGALIEAVNRCGQALLGLGLAPGDRVMMVVGDRPEFFYLFWGAIKAGLVPVPANTLLRARDLRFMIDDSGAALVVFETAYRAEAEPAIDGSAVRLALDLERLSALMEAAPPALDARPAGPMEDCFWLYSSGTTGRPKAAVHSHRDMVATSQRYGVEVLGLGPDDVCYSAAKLFFAYGLGNAMTFPLWVGATAVLSPDRPTPEGVFDMIERFRPTVFFGVPTLYASQLRALEAGRWDLSSLRLCVSAGEALPAEICRRWMEATGVEVLDGIGTTEALHIFISNRPGDVVPGSSGREAPGYRARIVDEDEKEVPAGTEGSLLIQGDSIASRYWNQPELTERTMKDGWLATGDTYVLDADGYYHYRGRSDDMIKVGGLWCSPFEVEECLTEHPDVLEAAVVGREDEDGLAKPEAHVVPAAPDLAGDDLAKALLARCKARLAPYKYPRRVVFHAELPKTVTGKIQRFKLRSSSDG